MPASRSTHRGRELGDTEHRELVSLDEREHQRRPPRRDRREVDLKITCPCALAGERVAAPRAERHADRPAALGDRRDVDAQRVGGTRTRLSVDRHVVLAVRGDVLTIADARVRRVACKDPTSAFRQQAPQCATRMAQPTPIMVRMGMHPLDATYAVVDVETTGFDRSRDRVVEVACVIVRQGIEVHAFSSLINPGLPIPTRATEVHHITDAHVAAAPTIEEVGPILERLCAGAIVVAHNAAFDRGFLPMLADRPGLCTLRLGRHVFPELRSHANQALRFALDVALPSDPGEAHRACSDARVTAAVLDVLLKRYLVMGYTADTDALLAFAKSKITFPRFPFGRHRNVPLPQIPGDYLRWMLRCGDPPFDEDIRATAATELERRSRAYGELVSEAV
jgi:exodeoxyribonuclease X